MRAARWIYVVTLIAWLAGTAFALPGDGETPATRGPRPNDGFDYFSLKSLGILAGIIAACFIAGAVVKALKGRSKST